MFFMLVLLIVAATFWLAIVQTERIEPRAGMVLRSAHYFQRVTKVAIKHNLGTFDVGVTCFDENGRYLAWSYLTIGDVNSATVEFAKPESGVCIVTGRQ